MGAPLAFSTFFPRPIGLSQSVYYEKGANGYSLSPQVSGLLRHPLYYGWFFFIGIQAAFVVLAAMVYFQMAVASHHQIDAFLAHSPPLKAF